MPDVVVPYDERWPVQYAEEAERLRYALGAAVVALEHVGSTAVPGLAGKPTVDIAVGVRKLADVGDAEIAAMAEIGYVYRGDAGVPGRYFFRKGATYPREFHVSVVEHGGSLWRDYLLLREYLRTNEEEAREYVDAKRAAQRATGSYWEHKRVVIEAMLDRARARAAAR